jgi:hypothetical protein
VLVERAKAATEAARSAGVSVTTAVADSARAATESARATTESVAKSVGSVAGRTKDAVVAAARSDALQGMIRAQAEAAAAEATRRVRRTRNGIVVVFVAGLFALGAGYATPGACPVAASTRRAPGWPAPPPPPNSPFHTSFAVCWKVMRVWQSWNPRCLSAAADATRRFLIMLCSPGAIANYFARPAAPAPAPATAVAPRVPAEDRK